MGMRFREEATMQLLLTNDDGIYAPGLLALLRRLSHCHQVTVVAPDRERSAVGHGITLHQPLRTARVTLPGGIEGYAVNGTPADCIKLAVVELMGERPQVVLSGINPGPNVGVNVNYSGTVAAAKEAALYGLNAVALSMDSQDPGLFDGAAVFTETLVHEVVRRGLPFGTFLNVNFPGLPIDQTAGVRISRQGIRTLSECFEKRTDPRNRTYYWQGADTQTFEPRSDIDGRALLEDCISITPIKCDTTDEGVLDSLCEWDLGGFLTRPSRVEQG